MHVWDKVFSRHLTDKNRSPSMQCSWMSREQPACSMTLIVLGLKSPWSRTLSVSSGQVVAIMKKHKYTYVLLRKDIISNVILQMGSSWALLNFHNGKKKICKTLWQLGCRLLLQSLHTYFNQSHQTLTLPSSLAICCGYYLKAMFLIQAEFPISKKTSSTCSRSFWGKLTG